MKIEQLVSQRDRDLNTRNHFLKALGISAIFHLGVILIIVLAGAMSSKPKILVPGYKVSLVMSPKPSTLQKKRVPKKKKKRIVKKAPKNVKVKKAKPKAKKKTSPKGKKIVPKKKEPEKPKKVIAPEKVEARKETAPKKPDKPKQRAVVAAGMPFPHLWYLKIVERRVDENWATHGIDIRGMRGDPVVRFSITRDGSLSSVLMEKSSGSPDLDASAVQAVRESSPFPPLPDDFPSNKLDVHFGFSYAQHE
ncbi:hypothetical protein MNBD_NITROSPINAE02-1124 [hydrothermal vent metagenome]|uniref:TonB C-terminal domain-containing protein n=1 Tax=hydrothermal vent metagenome TaxID=652676 RepID=A0A3B1BUD1_9ZZZZ